MTGSQETELHKYIDSCWLAVYGDPVEERNLSEAIRKSGYYPEEVQLTMIREYGPTSIICEMDSDLIVPLE